MEERDEIYISPIDRSALCPYRMISRRAGLDLNAIDHWTFEGGAPVAGSFDRGQEFLEALAEARRRSDEVTGARGDQSLRAQLGSERIGRPLEERGVVPRGDQHRDVAGLAPP